MYITDDRLAWLFAALVLLVLIAVISRSILRKEERDQDAGLFLETPLTFLYGVAGILLTIAFLLWILGVGGPLGVWTVIALVCWGAVGIIGHDLSIRRERRQRL